MYEYPIFEGVFVTWLNHRGLELSYVKNVKMYTGGNKYGITFIEKHFLLIWNC